MDRMEGSRRSSTWGQNDSAGKHADDTGKLQHLAEAAIARPARKIKASDVNINFLLVFIAEKKLVLLRYDNLRSHQLNKQFRFPLGELHSQIHCTL